MHLLHLPCVRMGNLCKCKKNTGEQLELHQNHNSKRPIDLKLHAKRLVSTIEIELGLLIFAVKKLKLRKT